MSAKREASAERKHVEDTGKRERERHYEAVRAGAKARLAAAAALPEGHFAERRQEVTKAEQRLQRDRLVAAARWSHKNEGTAETHERAARRQQGPLARLWEAGDISLDELSYATEIAMAAESIERDVDVRAVSYEPRIDCSASARNVLVETILSIRRQRAYTIWRGWLPDPKRMILDMIVGDAKAYSTVAKEYGVHKRRTKALLIAAIGKWPDALDMAEAEIECARAGI